MSSKVSKSRKKYNTMRVIYSLALCLFPLLCEGQVTNFIQTKEGVIIALNDGTLGIYPIADNAVRIKFFKGEENPLQELVFTANKPIPEFKLSDNQSELEVKTKQIIVTLDKQTGNLRYTNNEGKVFLSEKPCSRKLIAGKVQDEPCYLAEQSFESPFDEYVFGLGQFQDGNYNLKGISRQLIQVNSQIALPFIYSSKGYGSLWHQYGLTDYNPNDNFITLEKYEENIFGNMHLISIVFF